MVGRLEVVIGDQGRGCDSREVRVRLVVAGTRQERSCCNMVELAKIALMQVCW